MSPGKTIGYWVSLNLSKLFSRVALLIRFHKTVLAKTQSHTQTLEPTMNKVVDDKYAKNCNLKSLNVDSSPFMLEPMLPSAHLVS